VQGEGRPGPITPKADTTQNLNVFLNYRRGDASGYAGRLFDSLSARYGHNVFMDIDSLSPGTDFVDTINETLATCDILLVLVGRDWLTVSDNEGNRRLENPDDFVRLEIETALTRNILVVPVLVEGTPMPRSTELPGELVRLARRQAFELSDRRWNADVGTLITALERVLAAAATKSTQEEHPASTTEPQVVVAEAPAAATDVKDAEPPASEEPRADTPRQPTTAPVSKTFHEDDPANRRFDVGRWSRADRIAGVASIVLCISLFLPWYHLSEYNVTSSGLNHHPYLYIVMSLCILIVLYLAICQLVRTSSRLPVMVVATIVNFVITFLGFIYKYPPTHWYYGGYVALIAAFLAAGPYAIPQLRAHTR
jgi:hypothetical protein